MTPAPPPAPASARADVLFALAGDVRRNSRALKQLRALSELGLRVEVLSFGPPAGSEIAPGVRLHAVGRPGGGGPRFFWRVHRRFRRAARRFPAAVYHASDLFVLPALASAARRHGGRLVFDSRELYGHLSSLAGRPWRARFWRAVERRFIRRADAVFTVSDSIADRLAATYGIPRPVVVHNVPPYRTVARTDLIRERAGIPADRVVLLYQGDVKRGRGCDLLLDCMRDVERAVLVFLGDGPQRAELEARAAAEGLAGRVRFLNPVPPDELLPVTASADVGVVPGEPISLSLYLSLPNKLFEYLMAGLPVLASDLPEIRNVVEGFQVGRIVNPYDRPAFVRALREMVDDAAARAAWRANTGRVFETFSWETASERFQSVYRRLLGIGNRESGTGPSSPPNPDS